MMKKLGKKVNRSLRSVQAYVFTCSSIGVPECNRECDKHPDSGGFAAYSANAARVSDARKNFPS